MVARVLFLWLTSWGNMTIPRPATDHPALCLASRLRLMCIGQPSRSPNTHQPKNKPINIRRGEGGGRGVGRAFMVARVLFLWLTSWGNMTTPHPAGDHKGPPSPTSSTLAPTDYLNILAFFDAS